MSVRILVAEDDAALRLGVEQALRSQGYEVIVASHGEEALARVAGCDLVVLDVAMPKRSGFEVCREIRARGLQVPVLFLTVRNDEVDRVLAFELGADDYITKPFSVRELLARVAAILRRTRVSEKGQEAVAVASRVRIGEREVDFDGFVVKLGKKETPLAPKEAAMLKLLLEREGRVVSREEFLKSAWGSTLFSGPRTVDTHMGRLRAKLEDDPESPKHLLTVHGVGYRLVR